MSFSVDVVNLILYSAQQLGVMLGVGSASILLVAFLVAIHDGAIDPKEEQFGRAVWRVESIGLWIIILSGLAITAIHISSGALEIVLSPAFICKWLLIGFLFGAELFRQNKPYPHYIWEGVIGANWYALFIVHILAPIALWTDLLIIYVLWSVTFIVCYVALFHLLRAPSDVPVQEKRPAARPVAPVVVQKKVEAPKPVFKPVPPQPKPQPPQPKPTPPPQPKPVPPPVPVVVTQAPPPPVVVKPIPPPIPPMPERPHAPLPVVAQTHELATAVQPPKAPPMPEMTVPQKPAVPVPVKPAPIKPTGKIVDPDENPGLPAIRVMPRTPADVDKQNRASTVQF